MITRPCPAPAAAYAPRALFTAGTGVLAALFLAACGGGGSAEPPAAPPAQAAEVPASAMASDASWEAFAIAQAPSETAQPLQLDLIVKVPTSETESPIALP